MFQKIEHIAVEHKEPVRLLEMKPIMSNKRIYWIGQSRLDTAEEISEFGDIAIENFPKKKKKV